MKKKENTNPQKKQFVSESEYTVNRKGDSENIPPTGPMKGNPTFYSKQVGVKPTEKIRKKLEEDSHDITNEIVAQSAREDKSE